MQTRLEKLIKDYAAARGLTLQSCSIAAPDSWQVDATFAVTGQGTYQIRNLREGDVPLLEEFGRGLGAQSRDFFCPYPWADAGHLRAAFTDAVRHAIDRVDAAYLLLNDGEPVGHFFLWRAGGNDYSQQYGLEVPELGIAIADAFHKRGLGKLAMQFLEVVGEALGTDAIELTTAVNNESGWNTYLRAGFEFTGIIPSPLDVDVTAMMLGQAHTDRFRDERQMAYFIKPERREAVLSYLAQKRDAMRAIEIAHTRSAR